MRISSWIMVGAAGVVCGLYETSFAGSAPWPWMFVRLILPVAVMLLLLNRQSVAYVFLALSGITVDLISATNSDFAILRFMLVILIIDTLSELVTTNRSLYAAMILIAAARLINYFLLYLIYYLGGLLSISGLTYESFFQMIYALAFDLIITALLFIGFTLFTRRFLIPIPPVINRYDTT